MIIIQLQGGLGNQMFQYACGKAFALRHQQTLLIDDSFLKQNLVTTNEFTPRAYQLGIFKLNDILADEYLLKSFERGGVYKKVQKLLNRPYKKSYVEVPGMGARQLDGFMPPVLLKGYWQSEQYFITYRNEIRKTFDFDIPAALHNPIAEMHSTNSVSIHYRRTDYLTNPVARKVLGALDAEYYAAAVKQIKDKIGNPFFYIFSDDAEWVSNNLPVNDHYKIIAGHSGDKHWYDMLLMSKCKHHVIANSSFSWWGAWLNPDPQKLVIAPKRWFANKQMNANTTDLVPPEWIRI